MALGTSVCFVVLLSLVVKVFGQASLNTSIVGGQNTSMGSSPWLASLYHNGSQVCEGSLINRKWVLTAAQCFSSNITDGWVVYLGQQTPKQSNLSEVGWNLSLIAQHPNYTVGQLNNNIALVKLQFVVNITENIQPVSLAAKGSTFYSGTDTWVTVGGFPFLSNGNRHQVKIPVVGNRQCYCLYSNLPIPLPSFNATQNFMCAGQLARGGNSTCQLGSLGSPLVAKTGDTWVQAGVLNYTDLCVHPGLPGVYARVSQYEDWINSTITSNKPVFVTFTSNGTDSDNNVTCATPSSIQNSSQVFGQAPLNTSIVGGQNTSMGSSPWLASLYHNGSQVCEGSLINRKWVLTAAQCFSSNITDGWVVYLGQQTPKQSNLSEVGWNLSLIAQHPNYTVGQLDNNIALVKLQFVVNITENIQPIFLAANGSTFYSGTDTWVTVGGFPFLSNGNRQQVKIPVVGNRQCYCLYSNLPIPLPSFNATQDFMCAGQLARGGNSTCQLGSLGSPLVAKKGDTWVQAGVLNYANTCVQPGLPGVYARVSQYEDWINSTITSNKPVFVTFTSNGTDSDNNVTCATPSSIQNSSQVLGQAPLNTSIVGGQNTSMGSSPWLASLYHNGSQVCEGSLINGKWVLTAAQCFSSNITDGWVVYLGQQTPKQSNLSEVGRNLSLIAQHPNYIVGQLDNNIALVKLQSAVNFIKYIQPVFLAAKGSTFYNGTDTWVTVGGFPFLSNGNRHQVKIPVVGNRQCYCLYSNLPIPLPSFNATQNFMCAGQLARGGNSTCQLGPLGSPLVAKYGHIWIQSGLVNYECVQPGLPGVYARVSRYEHWINSTITSDKPGFVTFTSNGTDSDNNVTCATPSSIKNSSQVLGQAPLNTSIVGGQNTSMGSSPWLASLYHNGSQVCEGSLINGKWVLTAAQCFSSNITDGWVVNLGQQTPKHSNLSEVGRNLSLIAQHPNYIVGQFDYNIALVKLQSAVNFTKYIQPVFLAAKGSTFYSGTDTWVTVGGFPFLSNGNRQQVKIPVVGNRQCYCLYSSLPIPLPSFNATQNFMCAGQLARGGNSTCQLGSLGSPLVAKYGHIWIQSGLVNYECVQPGLPGVYARVSRYEHWINSTITSDKPGFVTFTSNGTDSDNNVTCAGEPPITRPSPPTPILPHSSTSSINFNTTKNSSTPTPTGQSDVCGLAPLNNGGSSGSVAAGMWPWQVSLLINGVYVCGGTLITRRYVMSAAQCYNSSVPNSQWTVVLGMNVSLGVTNISLSNLTGANIALLCLATSVTLTDYIQPVCLDLSNTVFTSGAKCWVTGSSSVQGGGQSLQQQETAVENCATTSTNQICTAALSSLTGYTGGPLVSKSRRSWFQGAVIMTGTSSTRATSQQVFIKTSKFKSFIGDVVGLLPQPSRAGQHFSALLSLTLPLLSLLLMSLCGH
ncbi:polyserase-2-like isoform X2 [Paramormyrops kingsleyae]|uniref:polyserase-2-like isoform X2 n=1 Tax=Paramormyrops kingsleyae TaxID=1676925 RepID=UPI003B970D2A